MNNRLPTRLRLLTAFFRVTRLHRLLCPFFRGMGLILVLHRVLPPTAGPRVMANARIEISPAFLDQLILFFRDRGYEIVSLDTVHERICRGSKGAAPFVCFTFDDGYADALEVVQPIFSRHRAPFAVYLVTGFPDRVLIPWWYMLEDLVLRHDQVCFTWQERQHRYPTSTMEEREHAYTTIRQLLLAAPAEELGACLEAIFSGTPIRAAAYEELMLSWQQVAALAADPLVTIGAHTVHHCNLRELAPDMVRREILASREAIEQHTGSQVRHFAYPFGSPAEVGRREVAIAGRCGFATCTMVNEGTIVAAHRNHLFSLPRVEVTGRYQDLTLVDMRRCGALSLLRNGLQRVVTL
ncbi:MAG TPA: polysaccharide deacetylase [Desulfobulbus sp.]|nr:polysaccharide deacetylase [Desulfobulbus sp.]